MAPNAERVMAAARTLVLVKPDAVRRGLVGEIVGRLERKGLSLAAAQLIRIDRSLAERHYDEHRSKPFFEDLVSFITSGPVLALAVEGPDAVVVVRMIMGPTNASEAGPGTIRGDFGIGIQENLVHGSDSPASAARELALFFPQLRQ